MEAKKLRLAKYEATDQVVKPAKKTDAKAGESLGKVDPKKQSTKVLEKQATTKQVSHEHVKEDAQEI